MCSFLILPPMLEYKEFHIWLMQAYIILSCLNSLRPSDAYKMYMRHQPGPTLVQIMTCCLFSTKPLSGPMLYYCQLDRWEQTSIKLYSKFKHFHSRKCIWKFGLENGDPCLRKSCQYQGRWSPCSSDTTWPHFIKQDQLDSWIKGQPWGISSSPLSSLSSSSNTYIIACILKGGMYFLSLYFQLQIKNR